jgi:hypothetical protein
MPRTFFTPYIWYKPHTISLITVLSPGQVPPHVTIQARTSSGSKYTWTTYNSMHKWQAYGSPLIQPTHESTQNTYPLTGSSTSKMYTSWTIFVNYNLQRQKSQKRKKKCMKLKSRLLVHQKSVVIKDASYNNCLPTHSDQREPTPQPTVGSSPIPYSVGAFLSQKKK